MLNKVMLQGRLTNEPELKYTPSGVAVVRFSLAVQRSYVKQGEERQTDFINCTAFRSTAEFISKYFAKASLVVAVGELQSRSWEDSDGNKRSATDVIVNEVHFAESKKTEQAPETESKYLKDEREGIKNDSFFEEVATPMPGFEDISGDLPF